MSKTLNRHSFACEPELRTCTSNSGCIAGKPLAPADASKTNVVSLQIMARPTFSVPICPDIAAFSRSVPSGGSQDIATGRLNGEWFDGKALFYVRGETLGFAIPSGTVAIVEAEPYLGRDRNLVIARHQGNLLARRLLKAPGSLGISLAAQTPGPRTPRPTQIHAILTRTTYIGEHRFNTPSHKDREKKPESEVAIMAVPPSIERKVFDAVQARLKSPNPMVTPARVSSGPTLLTGICFCAKCGGAMTLRTGRSSTGATYRYHTSQETQKTLRELHDLGVKFSLDDFGTGFSSLSYLQRFPFDSLKIDRSFVDQVTSRSDRAAIVRAILGLGRSLNISVIAEGVEAGDQLDWLTAEGLVSSRLSELGSAWTVDVMPLPAFSRIDTMRNGGVPAKACEMSRPSPPPQLPLAYTAPTAFLRGDLCGKRPGPAMAAAGYFPPRAT